MKKRIALLLLFMAGSGAYAQAQRFDEKQVLPYLRRDKAIYVQRVGALDTSDANSLILRGFLIGEVLCRVPSEAAKILCEDLLNSDEMDGQAGLTLDSFSFNPSNLQFVLKALAGLLEGAQTTLAPERVADARDLLLATQLMMSKSENDAEAAKALAANLRAKTDFWGELRNQPSLQVFSSVYQQIENWLEQQPSRSPLAVKTAPWRDLDYGMRCKITSRGGRMSCFQDEKPILLPQAIQQLHVKDVLPLNASFSGPTSFCVQTSDEKFFCWGEEFRLPEDYASRNKKAVEIWPAAFRNVVVRDKSTGHFVKGLIKDDEWKQKRGSPINVLVATNGSTYRVIYRGHVYSDRFMSIENVDYAAELEGVVHLPANATSLTLFGDRLYFLVDSELKSIQVNENDQSFLGSGLMNKTDLISLSASDKFFCGQHRTGAWTCLTKGWYCVRRAILPKGELKLNQDLGLVRDGESVSLAVSFDRDDCSFGQDIRLSQNTQPPADFTDSRMAYVGSTTFMLSSFCSVKQGQIECRPGRMVEGYKFETPAFFRSFRQATRILSVGSSVCVLEGTKAQCISRSDLFAPKPDVVSTVVDAVLAGPSEDLIPAGEGLCKRKDSEVHCLTMKKGPGQQTVFTLPKDEKFVRRVSQSDLCFQTDKAIRCYGLDGKSTWVLRLQARGEER